MPNLPTRHPNYTIIHNSMWVGEIPKKICFAQSIMSANNIKKNQTINLNLCGYFLSFYCAVRKQFLNEVGNCRKQKHGPNPIFVHVHNKNMLYSNFIRIVAILCCMLKKNNMNKKNIFFC